MIQFVVTELCTKVPGPLLDQGKIPKKCAEQNSSIMLELIRMDVKLARSQEMMERWKPQWQEEQGNGRKIDRTR